MLRVRNLPPALLPAACVGGGPLGPLIRRSISRSPPLSLSPTPSLPLSLSLAHFTCSNICEVWRGYDLGWF